MPNHFDRLKERTFDRTTNLMGYPATWTPSIDPSITHEAVVHLNRRAERDTPFTDNDYMPNRYYIEYRKPYFPNLEEISLNSTNEIILIEKPKGIIKQYWVMPTQAIWDGDTIRLEVHTINDI